MSQLECHSCRIDFNGDDFSPHIIPSCGHTFCRNCIENWIEESGMVLRCPEDHTEFSRPEGGLSIRDFPLNMYISKLLERKAPPARRSSEIESEGNCVQHGKATELICLTDGATLCVECVLFGAHKAHEYVREDDFMARAQKKLLKIKQQKRELDRNSLLRGSQLLESCRGKIKAREDLVASQISRAVEGLVRALQKRETSLRQEVREKFSVVESRLAQFDQQNRGLFEKSAILNLKLDQVEQELQAKVRGIRPIISFLMEEGEISQLFAEIRREVQTVEEETRDLIEKEIESLQVRNSLPRMTEAIESSLLVVSKHSPLLPRPVSDVSPRIDRPDARKKSSSRDRTAIIEAPIFSSQFPRRSQVQGGSGSFSGESLKDIEDELERSFRGPPVAEGRVTPRLSERAEGWTRRPRALLTESKSARNLLKDSVVLGGLTTPTDANARLRPRPFEQLAQANQLRHVASSNLLQRTNTEDRGVASSSSGGGGLEPGLARFLTERPSVTMSHAVRSSFLHEREHSYISNYSNRQVSDSKLPSCVAELMGNGIVKLAIFDGNQITDDGFRELLVKLSEHPSLERLSLRANKLTDFAIQIVDLQAKKLRKIKSIVLKDNPYIKSTIKLKKEVANLKKKGVFVEID